MSAPPSDRPRMPDEQIADASRELVHAAPQDVLRWAVRHFHPRLMMATAFGAEGCCLIHMLAEIEPAVTVINIDTGYQFPETLELRERIKARYGIEVEYVRPEMPVPEYEAEHGGPLYVHRPDQCCHDRKILPLRKAVERIRPLAWISAIRKDQTADRGQPREGEPAPELDEEGRVEVHHGSRRAVQPVARPELPEHRVLALHPGGSTGRGRPGRPLGRQGQKGVRLARDRTPGRQRNLVPEFQVPEFQS
jgi:hypothetical protein